MTKDQEVLKALSSVKQEIPDIRELITFYERLLTHIIEKKRSLTLDLRPYRDSIDAAMCVESGMPALQFDWLALEVETFEPWVHQVADILRERLPDLDVAEGEDVVQLARRFYETGTTEITRETDALFHNAVAPWLEYAVQTFVPVLRLTEWRRGYCPVCGGYPDFATMLSEWMRRLMCERCRAEWPFPAGICPFCNEQDVQQLGYYSSPDEVYRVDVCDSCGFYIKGVATWHYEGEPIPEVERLLTPGLDVMAAQEGYTHPRGWSDEE